MLHDWLIVHMTLESENIESEILKARV